MKTPLLLLLSGLLTINGLAQTDLITNGSFENSTSPWTGWSSSVVNGDLWAGLGNCGGATGTDYAWAGDQNESAGVNNLEENMYQQVTIPSNTTAAVLYFDASINTSESGGTYDQMTIEIQNTSGTTLESLGGLSNASGDAGISGCQTWAGYYVNIPNTYWGSTIRVAFEFSTDASNPTIFRVDDIELLVTNSNCSYTLSASSYTAPDNTANTYTNVATVTAGSGCDWTASVTTGSAWLSTTSSGSGNGNISIGVLENTTGASRSGTITVQGQTLNVTQPALTCEYTISPELYICPDYTSGTLTDIAIINTSSGCDWDANVLEGGTWLISNSNGTGSGTINITVLENNNETPRSGTIVVEGETLLVQQPANPWLTGIEGLKSADLEVFPNPASDQLTLHVSEISSGTTYRIIDAIGRTFKQGTVRSNSESISLEGMSAGTYMILIESDEDRISRHFIKR
ncbi:MAG: T9SS type A sorting domain-containing protein [Flavobacteriales bacterium]|nr:T9SS type A sorting domain-containing protein [Flavobacteriales bacterium]